MRRPLWSALIATACVGGQTGEITELTACDTVVGTTAIDEASEAGRSAEDQLAELTTSIDRDGVSVSVALSGEAASILSGEECARPWQEAPAILRVRTSDGALDEEIDGVVLLNEAGAASARGTLAMSAVRGAIAADYPASAIVRIDLVAEPDAIGGQVVVEDGDEMRSIASF